MATNLSCIIDDATGSRGLKHVAAVVSPGGLKNKKNKSHRYDMKHDCEEIEPRNLMGNNSELFCLDLRGQIQLIWCDQGSNEGFLQPFSALYFHSNPNDREAQRKVQELRKITKIIAMVPRRKNRIENEPIMKPPGKGDNGVSRFKKCYLVRFCPLGSCAEEKEAALCAIAEVLNEYNRMHSRFPIGGGGDSTSTPAIIRYIVPSNFDQTEEDLEAWDSRIIDNDIARLLRVIYKPRPRKDFASSLEQANHDNYFTPPYCDIAREEFGFGPMLSFMSTFV